MTITTHAVTRYRQRVRYASPGEVRSQLLGLAAAAFVEEHLGDGERWLRAGSLRLVAKDDRIVTCYVVGA